MSYQPGKMGIAAGISLIMAITFPYIFLTVPAQVLQNTAGLAWLSPLIGGIPLLLMLWAVIVIQEWMGGDLYEVCERLCGRIGAWIIGLYYIGLFFIDATVLLRQFAENTLLTALPRMEFGFIVNVYILVAAVIVYYGLESILRSNYIIMPFGIVGLVLLLVLLLPFYNIYELAPWQGQGLAVVIPDSLKFAGVSAGAIALVVLSPNFQNTATLKAAALYGVGLSTAIRGIAVFCFTLAFGPTVGSEKVLPFFEMARLVYLSRYIQRIEALFIILWVIVGLLAIAINLFMGLYLITRILRLPTMRPIIPAVAIILTEVAMLPTNIGSVIGLVSLSITTYFNIGLYVIPSLLVVLAVVKRNKRRAGHA